MTRRFSDHLHNLARPVWEAQHEHPFVRGIGDGSLDLESFKYWVRQDYLFLIDYARMLALACARSPDLETMRRFADLVHATLDVEMDLHRSYAAEFGISREELEAEQKSPTTRAYTDFLVRVAAADSYPELIAALLPCMWGFCEIGQRLAEGPPPADERYRKWIEMYSAPEFADLAAWCRELTDRVAEGLTEDARRRMEDAFLTSSRYELAFWQAAWDREDWSV